MSPRYGWIGSTRRERLVKVLHECVQTWLGEWCVAPETAGLQLENTTVLAPSPAEAYVVCVGPSGSRWMLAIGKVERPMLGNWLAGVETGGSDEPAAMVATEALHDLASQLAACAGHTGVPQAHGSAPWPQGAVRADLGAIGLRITVGGVEILAACERGIVDAICPEGAIVASPEALAERHLSIESASVEVTAMLDFGLMSAPELFDLQVGEVLIGECHLDTPARLFAPGAMWLAEARMCKTGDSRSVAILKPSAKQEIQ